MPRFGAPDRPGIEHALLTTNPDLGPYVPLARLADAVTRGARTPYGAVEKLEQWFGTAGIFRYSNHPRMRSPALVGFVTRTHAGYCQYFAGAMALMLRYLGIPARIAVGFAGGQYDPNQHLWNVTDREAHAWVEVWFKGYGWLPFDPTPAGPGAPPRGAALAGTPVGFGFGARGSTPSQSGGTNAARRGTSDVGNALNTKNGFGLHLRPHHGSSDLTVKPGRGGSGRTRPVLLLLLFAVLAAAVGAIVLAKAAFRLTRHIRRDPRGVAAACRQELAAFLVDQRVEAPRSATLDELGELVRYEFGVAPEAFVLAATAARFGPADSAAAAAVTARRELRSLLEGARRGLTRRERLLGLLSLRSLSWPTAPAGGAAS
jgi:hypothetical protein